MLPSKVACKRQIVMSAAQEKRVRTAKANLTSWINRVLIDFKNHYYQSYVDWNQAGLDRNVGSIPSPEQLNELIGKRFIDHNQLAARAGVWMSKHNQDGVFDKGHIIAIEKCRTRFIVLASRKALNSLTWLSEANVSYDKKLNNVIDKLIAENFLEGLKIHSIKNAGHEISFLIEDYKKDRVCHARAIFVNGAIKAPHYRFITTVRAIKS